MFFYLLSKRDRKHRLNCPVGSSSKLILKYLSVNVKFLVLIFASICMQTTHPVTHAGWIKCFDFFKYRAHKRQRCHVLYLSPAPRGTGPASPPSSPARTLQTLPWDPRLHCAGRSPRWGRWKTPGRRNRDTWTSLLKTVEGSDILFFCRVICQIWSYH